MHANLSNANLEITKLPHDSLLKTVGATRYYSNNVSANAPNTPTLPTTLHLVPECKQIEVIKKLYKYKSSNPIQ